MRTDALMREGVVVERECRYGTMRFLRTDMYIAQSLGIYGEFSEAELQLLRQLDIQGDVVTAGANIGAHVVALAQLVGPERMVYTAEPQPQLFEVLQDNLELNGLTDAVVARQAGLGAFPSTAQIPRLDYRWPNNFGSLALAYDGDGLLVDVTTIDELVGEAQVGLIHLDVEGWEAQALHGARETIRRCRPYLYLEVDRADKRAETMAVMESYGYAVLLHQPPLFNPKNFAGVGGNVFGSTVSIMALGIPVAA